MTGEGDPMKRVLVVDNNELELSQLALALGAECLEVVTTWSGREALDLLFAEKFDALLVDDYLPDLHVDSFLGTVSKLSEKPFVMVMKADPNSKDAKRFDNLKVNHVVDKRHLELIPQAIALSVECDCNPQAKN